METAFVMAWAAARDNAAKLGIRMRPVPPEQALKTAHRILSSNRLSDGFSELKQCSQLQWSLEALAVDKRFTALFTDGEANEALSRLMEAGYRF